MEDAGARRAMKITVTGALEEGEAEKTSSPREQTCSYCESIHTLECGECAETVCVGCQSANECCGGRKEDSIDDITADWHSLNRLYQHIEDILGGDSEDFLKLISIGERNQEIGEITARWI